MTGAELRTERKRLRVNQEELGAQANLDPVTIRAIEAGSIVPERPSCEDLAAIARRIAEDRVR